MFASFFPILLFRYQETEGWEVLLGEQQVGMAQKWQEKRTLHKIVLHAAYVDMNEGYDIAMAMLSRPVVFNDSIGAICAPYSTHQFPFGSTCWTRGWRTGMSEGCAGTGFKTPADSSTRAAAETDSLVIGQAQRQSRLRPTPQ